MDYCEEYILPDVNYIIDEKINESISSYVLIDSFMSMILMITIVFLVIENYFINQKLNYLVTRVVDKQMGINLKSDYSSSDEDSSTDNENDSNKNDPNENDVPDELLVMHPKTETPGYFGSLFRY